MSEELISIKKAAEILGVNELTVKRAVKGGKLAGKLTASGWQVYKSAVMQRKPSAPTLPLGRASSEGEEPTPTEQKEETPPSEVEEEQILREEEAEFTDVFPEIAATRERRKEKPDDTLPREGQEETPPEPSQTTGWWFGGKPFP